MFPYRKRQMKAELFGLFVIILGICLGLYLGVYLLLFGGLIQFIHGVYPLVAKDLAGGFVRVLLSAPVGWITFFVVAGIGVHIIDKS